MQWLPETSCKRGHIPALFAKLPSRPFHGSSTRTFDLQLRSQSSAGRSCSLHSKLIECSWAAGAISLPLHCSKQGKASPWSTIAATQGLALDPLETPGVLSTLAPLLCRRQQCGWLPLSKTFPGKSLGPGCHQKL